MVVIILTIVFVFTLASIILNLVTYVSNKIILSIAAGLIFISLIMAIRGILWPGRILTPGVLFLALLMVNVFGGGNGIFDSGVIGIASIVTISSLLLGNKGTLISSVIVTLSLLLMGLLDILGIYNPTRPGTPTFADIGVIIFVTVANSAT